MNHANSVPVECDRLLTERSGLPHKQTQTVSGKCPSRSLGILQECHEVGQLLRRKLLVEAGRHD
jgi:hypothetical protein